MSLLILAGLLPLADVTVNVQPLAGAAVRGELLEIQPGGIAIRQQGETTRWDWKSLRQVTAASARNTPEEVALAWVQLVDGSQLPCVRYTASAGTAELKLATGAVLSTSTARIRSVRFRDFSSTPEREEQWREIAKREPDADRIVVRRAESLDHLDGRVRDVRDDIVQFEFEGQSIEVKRTKLDGIVYYHPALGELPERLVEVVDTTGGRWNLRSLQLEDHQLKAVTVVGVEVALPLASLVQIDFTSGNSVWLDELPVEGYAWQPFIASRLPEEQLLRLPPALGATAAADRSLLLAGTTYTRGLGFYSRSEVTFRLTGGFQRLQALVGLDEQAGGVGHVDLEISGDGASLFRQEIDGGGEPIALDLDIEGVRRLKILVDYGRNGDLGDQLDFCDARLTK